LTTTFGFLAACVTLWAFVTIGFGGGIPLVPVDIHDAGRDNVTMQVTLTKDLKDFIVRKVRGGGYTRPGEVVREALRDFRTKDDPAEADSRELAELLLPAVRGRHRPLTARHFGQLRLRARRKPVRS
jgi:Arc/MetJ-type ribon-helix-helix transcriptional regulator